MVTIMWANGRLMPTIGHIAEVEREKTEGNDGIGTRPGC